MREREREREREERERGEGREGVIRTRVIKRVMYMYIPLQALLQ